MAQMITAELAVAKLAVALQERDKAEFCSARNIQTFFRDAASILIVDYDKLDMERVERLAR